MIRLLPWLLLLAVTVYAVIDCIQTDDAQVRGLPKLLWLLLILLFPIVGTIAWFIAGRPQRGNAGGQGRGPGGPSHRPPAPRGPDDDPDFLRRL
ncbi:Phospholipase_D-nuclease N-terminal [Pedococcus dokdonensis]|uniref:Phospholipase_D-nuclease N-terminal n=1 Tax=Pedococcus dokdonensis TaxID=443156 RepID=A0A1H0UZS3_9MICO|nr:PLDc N-terminal domain-containing protein [Pedococcus dokdonensis]SDP71583.1 Phospholipase_D-nuclease N-terminal [Pedococcus dokdonensis]